MHRRGHYGVDFLVLALIDYIFLSNGHVFFAVVALGALWIEPLPDYDLRTPLLTHRKTSHSLLAVVVVGGCCAGLGWVVGTYVTMPLLPWLRAEVLLGPQWRTHVGVLDAASLSLLGFCVGAGGIVLHLLGDIITVSGIQPLLPFSRWKVAPLPLRAASPFGNNLLFVSGILALVAVGVTMTLLDEILLTQLGLG